MALPLLVIGALAVVQVARVAADQVAVHHAAREAARHAALMPERSAVTDRAIRAAPDLDPARLRVMLGPERERGSLLRVRVVYRSPTTVPLVGRLIGDVEVEASAVVRLE